MLYFAFIPITVSLYCILALLFHAPAFSVANAFVRKTEKSKKTANILEDIIKKLSPHVPVNIVKRTEMQKLLDAASISETPQFYLTRVYLYAALVLLLIPVVLFIHPFMCIVPLAVCWFIYNHFMEGLKKSADKRKLEIEKEMPRFISYMANTLKTQRNVITCIDVYKANYDTALTQELSITTADMRTGNAEKALQRLEMRVNSPYISQLVRGLLSSMRGNDMTVYFDSLGIELTNVWEQRLRAQALRKEPKITRMSYILFALSLITVCVVLAVSIMSATSVFGGM